MDRKLREKYILRHFNLLIYAKGIMGKKALMIKYVFLWPAMEQDSNLL